MTYPPNLLKLDSAFRVLLPEGATGATGELDYQGPYRVAAVLAGGTSDVKVIIPDPTAPRLGQVVALDDSPNVFLLGARPGDPVPPYLTLRLYPEFPLLASAINRGEPIILSGRPHEHPEGSGLWDLEDLGGDARPTIASRAQIESVSQVLADYGLILPNLASATAQLQGVLAELADTQADVSALLNLQLRDNLTAITGADGLYKAIDTGYVYQRTAGVNTRRPNLEAATPAALATTDGKAVAAQAAASTALSAQGNLTRAGLNAKTQADGPQQFDGSRWVWAASGTPNGGTVLAAAGGGVWVREAGLIWSARWFAVPGEADSSAALQAAVNALPIGGAIEGFSEEYNVLDLKLKSNMSLLNIKFKQLAGSVDLKSTLVIDGRVAAGAKSGILLLNVHVDGNRANQTNIITGSEDGGRHGFRVIGRVYDLTITDSSANNCASDGLEMYSADQIGVGGDYTFRNIKVRRSTFSNNRRHGASLDAGFGVLFEDCVANGNGLDLNTTDAVTHGNRGSRFGGQLYGNGIDVEGYDVGSACRDLRFTRCDLTGNALGSLLFLTQTNPDTVGYVPWRTLIVDGCNLDYGLEAHSEGWGVLFTPKALFKAATAKAFVDVRVLDCTVAGYVGFQSVDGPQWAGGEVFAPAPKQPVTLEYCVNPMLGRARLTGGVGVETIGTPRWVAAMDSMAQVRPAPSFVFEAGPAGSVGTPTITAVQTTTRGTLYQIALTFTPSAVGTYASFRVTPAAGSAAAIQVMGAVDNDTGVPRATSILAPLIYLTLGDTHPVQMRVDVLVT